MPSTPQMPVLSRRLRQFGGGALSGRTPSPLTAFATAGMSDQRRAVATGTGSNGSPAPLGYRPCGLPRHHLRGDRRRERSGAGRCLLQMAPQGPGGDRPPGGRSLSAVARPRPWTAARDAGADNKRDQAREWEVRRIKTQACCLVPGPFRALPTSAPVRMRKAHGGERFISRARRCALTVRPEQSRRHIPEAPCPAMSKPSATGPGT